MSDIDNNSSIAILGSNIKQVRELVGISQETLAERIGKSTHFVSLLECNKSGLSVNTLIYM